MVEAGLIVIGAFITPYISLRSMVRSLFPADSYVMASNEDEMTDALAAILCDRDLSRHLILSGLRVIHERHCNSSLSGHSPCVVVAKSGAFTLPN